MYTNKQGYRNRTGHARASLDLLRLAKIEAAKSGESIRSLVDHGLGLVLALVDDFRTANWDKIIPYPDLVFQQSHNLLH